MTHLLILCEGHSEQKVLENFLRPFWSKRFETVDVLWYDGNGDLLKNFKGDAERQLATEPDSSVLCLIDLYQVPHGLYDRQQMTVAKGYQSVRDHMLIQIQSRFHPRFGAFPVAMELETWLLADPAIQRKLNESIVAPETIPHPVSFLEKSFASRNAQYGKMTDSVVLLRQTNAQRVYDDNCPHFKLLADWLTTPPPKAQDVRSEAVKAAQAQWEAQRDEKCRIWENSVRRFDNTPNPTDETLNAAIVAQNEYDLFMTTHSELFQ